MGDEVVSNTGLGMPPAPNADSSMATPNGDALAEGSEGSGEEESSGGVISFPVLIMITINSILGTGVFFLPALGAKVSGPASLVSWLIMGFYAMGMAAVFAELSGMFAFGGGVYEYCKQAFGSFFSFVVGWMTLVSSYVTIAMLIVGAISYIFPVIGGVSLFGFDISATVVVIAICFFFIIAFNFIAYQGMQTGSVMLVTFAIITLSTLGLLMFPAWKSGLQIESFKPFIPMGFSSIFVTLFFISETFFGWESVCFFSPQVKNGRKNVPKAILIGTFLIVLIAFAYVFSMMNGVGAAVLGSEEFVATPISMLGEAFYGSRGYDIFTILCYVAIIGSVAGWIVATPDLVRTLGADRLFPAQLADIHPVKGTPYKAIIFQTIVICILTVIGAGSYESLLHMLLPMVLVMYSFVVVALLVLRKTKPDQPRSFRMPLASVIGVILIIFNVGIIGFWIYGDFQEVAHCKEEQLLEGEGDMSHCKLHSIDTILFALSFICTGIPVYFLMKMYYDPEAIKGAHESTAVFNLLFENWFVPKRIRREVMDLSGDLADKNVLEYGCGVGSLTQEIAAKVGKHRRVYITSISKKELEITQKRLVKKNNHEHVIFIHDEHHVSRVHPDVGSVDVVISFGMMSYIQDVRKILNDIDKIASMGAHVCFVDYSDYFHLFPNAQWMAKIDKIEEEFRQAGYLMQVKKLHGFFWNYIFVYGVKSGLKDENSVPVM